MAEVGEGPMVLFLHGFPMFWWTWRQALPVVAAAGYRAVAMDLRGYGGSDHTPRGYDPFAISRDIVGVIRSLGAPYAVIVGHGWGGFLAWTTAALHPSAVSAIAPISMAHPVRLRESLLRDPEQRRASRYSLGFQRPWVPERQLVADGAERVGTFMREWSANDAWLTPDVDSRFRQAFMHTNTAHCALEYYRWSLRAIPRTDGRGFFRRITTALVSAPVLQIHGAQDPAILPRTAAGSQRFATGPYAWRSLPDTGHMVPEERPEQLNDLLTSWLADGCQWSDPQETDPLATLG